MRGASTLVAPLCASVTAHSRSRLCKIRSELHFYGELEIPWIARAGDGPESRAAKRRVRIVQRRRIRYVEHFGTELGIHALGEAEHFAQHEVGILQARPADRVARAVTDRELRH